MELKNNFEDYIEDEFIEFLNNFFEFFEELIGDELLKFIDNFLCYFNKII